MTPGKRAPPKKATKATKPKAITLHAGQLEALESYNQRRFTVLACGRRWGKTTFGVALAQTLVTKGMRVGWLAPNYKLLLEAYQGLARALPSANSNVMERRIELGEGVAEFWTASGRYGKDPARGRAYDLLVVDEAAMVEGLMGIWQFALRPTLTDYQGRALFMSTPRGFNDFYTLAQLALTDMEWGAIRAPTSTNPHIPAAELEAAKASLPDWVYRQEYLAEFVEVSDSKVFKEVQTAPAESPVKGGIYVMGVDWGRTTDATVAVVVRTDCTPHRVVALSRSVGTSYDLQHARVVELYNSYRPRAVVSETNGLGDPNTERLARAGLPVVRFTTTNASKASAIEELAMALESGRLLALNDQNMVEELNSMQATRLPNGGVKYSAPSGAHDDIVMALAMAYSAARRTNQNGLIHKLTGG